MAIVVDKEQKRKDIALSCRELFVSRSMSGVTISEIAKVAGVGKGTLYEYFKNKEEIVFELAHVLLQEHALKLQEEFTKIASIREKVKKFAEFFYTDETSELRTIYKDFVSISLAAPNSDIREFNTACFNNYYLWFVKLIEEGVSCGELIGASLGLTKGLFVAADGMFMASCTTDAFDDLEQDLNEYIENIFNIIEVKQ